MARAKRTDRTDRRRRYRAELAASDDGPVEDTIQTTETTEGTGRRRRGAPSGAPAGGSGPAPARPSMTRALRGAFHPLNLRGDIQALPEILRHWSIFVAIGVSVAAIITTAVFIVETSDLRSSVDFSLANPGTGAKLSPAAGLTYSLLPMLVTPPPLAGALFVGFFARRASWMLGLLYGIVAAACYSVLVITFSAGSDPTLLVAQAWITGPLGAALFAAAAAWYRRFLDLINPNRGRRPAQGQAKPVQGRGNVPRNRLSGQSRR